MSADLVHGVIHGSVFCVCQLKPCGSAEVGDLVL